MSTHACRRRSDWRWLSWVLTLAVAPGCFQGSDQALELMPFQDERGITTYRYVPAGRSVSVPPPAHYSQGQRQPSVAEVRGNDQAYQDERREREDQRRRQQQEFLAYQESRRQAEQEQRRQRQEEERLYQQRQRQALEQQRQWAQAEALQRQRADQELNDALQRNLQLQQQMLFPPHQWGR